MASGSSSQQEMTGNVEIPFDAQIPYGIKKYVIMEVIVFFEDARRGNMDHRALTITIKRNPWLLGKTEVFHQSLGREFLKVRAEMEIYSHSIQSSCSQIMKEFMKKEFMEKEQHTEYLDLACNYAKFMKVLILIHLGQSDEYTKECPYLKNAYNRMMIEICKYESRWHHEAPPLNFNVLSDHQNQKKDIHFSIQNFEEYYQRQTRRQQYLNNNLKTSDKRFPPTCCRFKFFKRNACTEYRHLIVSGVPKTTSRLQEMRKQTQNNREKARGSFLEQFRARFDCLRLLEEKDLEWRSLYQSPSNASPSTDNNIEQLLSKLDINRQNHKST